MTRRTTILTTLSFLVGVAWGSGLIPSLRAQTIRTSQTSDLMRVDLGSWCEGKGVKIQLFEAGPGTSGKHYHPAHTFNWVIEGSEIHTVEGRPPITAKAGHVLHDGPGEVHEAQNSAPVKLLVFRIIEKGKPVTTRLP